MESTTNLVARCFGCRDPELHIGGISISSLADRYGTPLFVYDRSALDQKLQTLRRLLPQFEVYYSVKANPNLAILRHFILRGCGLGIGSSGEFIQALAAGCPPELILMTGLGKTDGDLELALGGNVGEIHIESPGEAARIAAICGRAGIRARVGIRVNPISEAQGGAMRIGGDPAPFGVDEEELDWFVNVLASRSCFDFRGLHMAVGTQILDWSILINQYRKTIQIARAVVSRIGRPLQTIDFGGGLGIPCFPGEQELDLSRLAKAVAILMDEVQEHPDFRGTRFVIQPGRFLIGEAGVYVTRIVDIKESRGKKFLILDGGINHHLAASGNFGQTIQRNYPVALVEKLHSKPVEQAHLVGPLSTPLDTLGRNINLPKANVGDLVGIFQSGAYARSASPMGFLSHNTPVEVLIDDGKDFLIRSRGCTEDLMRDVCIPSSLLAASAAAG
jgi:diaminopimelate decarboxylase